MLLEYLETVNAALSIQEVWDAHVKAMKRFGFEKLLYGFSRHKTESTFGNRHDNLMLSNHDQAYLGPYIDGGLFIHAPMVNWARENVGACSWAWVQENYDKLTEREKEVVAFNRRMGVVAGYTISFRDVSSRAKGAIGLCAPPGVSQEEVEEIWRRHGRVIVQMNNVAHLKLTSLPFASLRKPLTARQREVLEWVGEGKTIRDIATIMGLTRATVEKHLRLAREALEVETTAQAVYKAAFQNQIFVLDPSRIPNEPKVGNPILS